ncbi:histidine phosphatase family protein [Streptomyces sp. ME01-24h]|nr:histidine phosphatase family protein [Streptomyces sp. ME19-03-3]MDX3356217.1 histidine phosphatase family protein [Streptomyces sp. ME01-24h]
MASWIIAVRHGESEANVAFARGRSMHGVRDADVALSALGWEQSALLGNDLLALPASQVPGRVCCSPFERARQTLRAVEEVGAAAGRDPLPVTFDARLRDRGMGVLELLTPEGIRERFPAEARRREREGEAVYRPPGGESVGDVEARVREFLGDAVARPGPPLLLVTHDAVVLALRGLLGPPPPGDTRVINASMARWWREGAGSWRLVDWNRIARPGH